MIRFLHIEDDVTDAFLFDAMLKEAEGGNSCVLTHAASLEEALEVLGTREFDGVLLDLTLKENGGLTALNKLTDAYPRIPVVVLGAAEHEAIGAEALSRGAQDFLVKDDMSASSFARALRYAIERKRLFDQLLTRNSELQAALDAAQEGQRLIRICSVCRRAADSAGEWQTLETLLVERSTPEFTHGYCPECARETERALFDDQPST